MSIAKSAYTNKQIAAWLRGLLTIAWADGNFDAKEQKLITTLTQAQLAAPNDLAAIDKPIAPAELAAALGPNSSASENFLRTAVMVAIADGIYSVCEADILNQFCQALGQPPEIISALQPTLCDYEQGTPVTPAAHLQLDALNPVRNWLDELEIQDPKVARFLCKMIPAQCPFERDVSLFGRKVVHIPPLCKLNPLYEQLVGLRFRALSYLADECKEDVSAYV